MWIFVLEAAIALGLLVFIVWWTLAPAKKRENEESRRQALQQTSSQTAIPAPDVKGGDKPNAS